LVEHLLCKQGVGGSSPLRSTSREILADVIGRLPEASYRLQRVGCLALSFSTRGARIESRVDVVFAPYTLSPHSGVVKGQWPYACRMALCPNCGQANPEIARLCMMCGTPLQEVAHSHAEERKVVSVLFVDLVGFTARSHAADPEDVRAALGPYHALLKREIERFGGTVEKFIGDAVMAVFGAPVAHEDDAERAVRAALRIIEAITELNDSRDLDLSIRAAVNTGEGLVTLGAKPDAGEGMVTGDVVNTTSRLQNVAPVNGVVVGEITYRSTKDMIDYQQLDPATVKGKPEPLSVWHAVAAKSRFGADADMASRTTFIGRESELDLLKGSFRRALRESSIQVVTITGEPGVGKSRLLSELFSFIDEERELVWWRQGRCLPYGEGITFWALGEIVKAHAGILESDSSDEAATKLRAAVEAVVRDTSEQQWFLSRLGPLVGVTGTETSTVAKEESFTAWRRFLEAIAEERPLVLVFEDLHWADPTLLEFIEHLVDWVSGVPMFVLCTARPELYDNHRTWGGGKRNFTILSLSPLDDSETAQLISSLLSHAVLPAEIHAALLERAGGNPLYAEEFIRMLFDRGILEGKGRVLTLASHSEIPVPDNVHALIAARLDTLSRDHKALLHDASVVGKVFWSGAVAALGKIDDASARSGLHDLLAKQLVRPARSASMRGQQEYAFWHALIKDVSYAQIPRTTRMEKHKAVAAWIESVSVDRIADFAEVLVHHYDQALNLAKAAGSYGEIDELEARSLRFLVMAGERAEQLDAGRAYDYYLRALSRVAPDDPQRPEVLVKAATMGFNLGSFDEAEAHAQEALSHFRKGGDVLGQGGALGLLSTLSSKRGRTEQGRALNKEAIDLLETISPTRALSAACRAFSFDLWGNGSFEEALEWASKALDLAERLGDKKAIAAALDTRAAARIDLGDLEGLADERRALEVALEVGDAERICIAYINQADDTWWMDGPAKALELHRKAIEIGQERGVHHLGFHATAESVWMLFDLGRWDELLRETERVLEWAEAQGSTYLEAIVLPYKAVVRLLRGEPQAAKTLEGRFVELATEIGELQVLAPALVIAAITNSTVGESAVAEGFIEELEQQTDGRPSWRAHYLPDVVRVLFSLGQFERAEELLASVRHVPLTRDQHSVVTAGALVGEAKGDLEDALRLFRDATQRWDDYGHVFEHAQALAGTGRCLLALGQTAEGSQWLQGAREIFVGLGAAPLIEEIDGYLGQPDALSS
jgi:class 3 adenylate cyclase/tetratricopeptide (TPR) repeat protein